MPLARAGGERHDGGVDNAQRIDLALAHEAIAQVRTWVEAARHEPVDRAASNLAGLLKDPGGLEFATRFVDEVVRPEDPAVSARAFRDIARRPPRFLPPALRALVRLGGSVAPAAPRLVVPIARRVLRGMVRHLVVDASDARLGPALARIGSGGVRLNVNLLGEAVLGSREAERRVAGTIRLIERPDVDYVSIKVSSTVAPHSPWAHERAVADAAAALAPVYRAAIRHDTFVNLDMEEYRDLDLTLDVFERILDDPELRAARAGVVLQAYLPDSLAAMMRLQEWAAARGGEPIKVRLVKGANLPMERVDAEIHDWPLATWPDKAHTDANYKKILDYVLTPERVRHVRIGVAGHNLFDVALARLLAERRGVSDAVEFEMLLGMATQQAAVVRRDVGSLLLYTPVVHPGEFDVAIAYLVRRLEEGASAENFMSSVFDLEDPSAFDGERDRFLASIELIPDGTPEPTRTMNRATDPVPAAAGPFRNAPDTDPSLSANRDWAAAIRERMPHSTVGRDTSERATIRTPEELDGAIAEVAASDWGSRPASERAAILRRAGDEIERRRGELIEVMASECGKVIEQSDPEVSEAADFARFYADGAEALGRVDGARFAPVRVTAVIPPWNFPAAIPAGGVLAALAAGSPVVFKPASRAARTGAVIAEALWAAGVPRDALRLVRPAGDLGSRLIGDERVERVILTGSYETAERFREVRPGLTLLAETSGKNAIIVTPSADLDLAARDIANSAFGHAGQKCSAASLIVLVGSVGESERFRRQLLDAVEGYAVGMPWDEASRIGPLIAPAEGKLLRGLTTLEEGQSWLLEPRQLGEALWTPGIRLGVRPGSEFHLTEYFGPVAGIMTAETLEEAIDIVNAVDYGLTSGLHSLDEDEIGLWLARIEAGNAYVNRGTTGAIVERQPFGGWKKSSVGPGTKAGGPSYLFALGTWADADPAGSAPAGSAPAGSAPAGSAPAGSAPAGSALSRLALRAADPADREWLSAALASDAAAAEAEFARAVDVQGLACEQNVLRYAPVPVTVRFEGSREAELIRVVAAGLRAGSRVDVSAPALPSQAVRDLLVERGVTLRIEDAERWAARAETFATQGTRIRLIGGSRERLVRATGGSPLVAIWDGEVTRAGRVEMLPFLREQAVSVTAHRFGTPRRYDIPVLVR